ncbi:hypothetical protein C2G38_2211184 [Gigaspora rosea]|uniref:Uncharacterized protein n=1 Tax=Gigaspora rosea TaxID=44941 RepID=A0A397UEL6_9GLOM|nr:hypothetical protein C2G38_2211184 [Gigaspora rosea]
MPQWQNLDVTWILRFFEVAEKIKSEHEALNFERFWTGIISEFEKKNEIYYYKATREQLLLDLSIIDDKTKMAKEELAKIFNTNNVQSEINLISSQNSENENNTNSGTISDLVLSTQNSQNKINASNDNTNESGKFDNFETSKSHQDRERIPTPTRDNINELDKLNSIENLSISKAKKSMTTSTQKDNAYNVNDDTMVDLDIRTSGTSQADESVNTSTQDDDSHNTSNNTTISLGVSSTRKGKVTMYSHARENTSNNAIVDLVKSDSIGTSGTSQADKSVNTSTQDDDSHNASNDTIINLGVSSTRKGKEIMYSHARKNTSNNAIVDLDKSDKTSNTQDNASNDELGKIDGLFRF